MTKRAVLTIDEFLKHVQVGERDFRNVRVDTCEPYNNLALRELLPKTEEVQRDAPDPGITLPYNRPVREPLIVQGSYLAVDFSGCQLDGIDGRDAVLTGPFVEANLREANFYQHVWNEFTNFSRANFVGAHLNHSWFKRSSLTGANITAYATNCFFERCSMQGTVLGRTDEGLYVKCDLRKALFGGNDSLYKAVFIDCDMQGAVLHEYDGWGRVQKTLLVADVIRDLPGDYFKRFAPRAFDSKLD